MKRIDRRTTPAGLILLAMTTAAVNAQTSGGTASPAATVAPEPPSRRAILEDLKKPTDWFSWGGDLRTRNEYLGNSVSISDEGPLHEQDVQRFRGRVWTTLALQTNLTFNARFTAEPREWIQPAFVGAYKAQTGMEWRFGIADILSVRWDNIFNQPLSLTVGRQDVLPGEIGDGWLIGDGTPLDGSMTSYLDGVRLRYVAEPIQTRFNVMYIYQNAHPDEWVPTLGDATSYYMMEQREQGVVLHASNKSIKKLQLDGYFIYKRDDRETFEIAGARKTLGDNADIYTTGGSITWTPAEHWIYSAEGAYQQGWKEDKIQGTFAERDLDAFGAKTKLTYLVKDPLDNQVSLIGEFLSGDDPHTTDRDEMFDSLWGRYPQWGDLAVYAFTNEAGGRLGQINNIGRIGANWTFKPWTKLTFSATYNALLAPEDTATRGAAGLFSGNGSFRGHYAQGLLKWNFNKHLSGHLDGEWLWEGNYYNQRDLMSFVRAEVIYTF